MSERVLRADARRNLEAILQAAGECFAERGLEVGVAEVARRAGVGTATIFRRFPTKEELVAAVLEARLEEILRIGRESAELPGGLDAVRSFFERAVEFQLRDRGFIEGVGKRMFASSPRLEEVRDELFGSLDVMVARAQEAGEVRDDVGGRDLPVLLHALGHAAMLTEDTAPGMWKRYLAVVLEGLQAGATTPLPGAVPTVEQLDTAKRSLDAGCS